MKLIYTICALTAFSHVSQASSQNIQQQSSNQHVKLHTLLLNNSQTVDNPKITQTLQVNLYGNRGRGKGGYTSNRYCGLGRGNGTSNTVNSYNSTSPASEVIQTKAAIEKKNIKGKF